MAASGVAEISAAASMEDCWMYMVWKSCWGWCSCGVKAKTMMMVMEGCPTAAVFPRVFLFFCVFPSLSFMCCCFVLLLGNEGEDDGDGWGCMFG